MKYYDYIQSNQWYQKRQQFYDSKLSVNCYICGTFLKRNLHHRSYKRLGKEYLRDLIVLCQSHHFLAHTYVKTAKQIGLTRINIWNVIKKFKKRLKKNLPPPIEEWKKSIEVRSEREYH